MDADKIKNFFLNHFEKMILGLVIAGSGYLIYAGWSMPNFLDSHKPDLLVNQATQVKSNIDENHNDEVLPERQKTFEFDIVKETARIDSPVDHSYYSPPQTWSGKSPHSIVRRQDPELLVPRALIVKPVVASIAIRGSETVVEDYPLASFDAADPLERVEQPKPRERRTGRRNNPDMMDQMMMESMGMEDSMEMQMQMMTSADGGASGPGRRFDAKYDFGLRPKATDDKRNPKPAVGAFIAGTAVLPHKEVYENFRRAFQDADQFDPRRDTPFYYDLVVQRADVTDKPVDQLTDADWVKVWDRTLYTQLAAFRWSGFAPEVVPADYRDDALTMWIPPVLLDDYRSFALHPMIPKLSRQELERVARLETAGEEIIDFSEDMDNIGLVAPGQSASAMSTMGMDFSMDYGMSDSDYAMDGMMMGMGMAMMGRRGMEENPVDYKLIRFYDFAGFRMSPQPGRKYVYRLKYAVNDPNFPFSERLQPKLSSLAPDVALRVQTLMSDALREDKRSFRRWSDWSEPSEPVGLSSLEQYFAGPIEQGPINVWKVAGRDVEYVRDVPTAKLLTSQFDVATGARIPLRMDVTEGTVLSQTAETADVVDPITLSVKKFPNPEFVSGTTIVDLDGGVPLKFADGLKSPGVMLLYDQTGELRVSSEVDDQEMYRIYTYADERGE